MNKRSKQRLLSLAKFLVTKVPKEKFNLNSFTRHREAYMDPKEFECSLTDEHSCGTTACAVGWCPVAFPRSFKFNKSVYGSSSISIRHRTSGRDDFHAAEEYFGLDVTQCGYLFDPQYYRSRDNTSAEGVAKRIKQFVADNGEVPARYRN